MKPYKKEYLFVDGYNIINSWQIFSEDVEDDLESARNKLIEIMIEYKHYTRINVIIVYDGHLVKGGSGLKENRDGVEIVFTRENETADNYIERTIGELGPFKKIRVATSDWMEQQIILGRGGIRISARELESEIAFQKRLVKRKMNDNKLKNKKAIGNLSESNLKTLEKLLNGIDNS